MGNVIGGYWFDILMECLMKWIDKVVVISRRWLLEVVIVWFKKDVVLEVLIDFNSDERGRKLIVYVKNMEVSLVVIM